MVGRQAIIYRQCLPTRLFMVNCFELACHMCCSLPNASDLFRWPQFYRKSSLEGGRLSDRLLEGEGVWTPYIQTSSDQTVACRTFLQPDPQRPYTVIGVVAFDLTRTRLHYVLGTQEPSVPKGPKGTGTIPPQDQRPGILLATFNGGFKGTHGYYGAMQAGIIALPPRDGFADGQITPRVATDLVGDWGGNYAGVQQGLELDINPYWVHFTAIQPQGSTLVAEPLFPAQMKESKDRYLHASARDFFYVTASP
jgi:hypothetical protein